MKATTKDIGDIGEKAAAKYLKKHGYRVVDRNVHVSHEELDLIVKNRKTLVFCEVKTRTIAFTEQIVRTPGEAVSPVKIGHLLNAETLYLVTHPTKREIRNDVVEVLLDRDTLEVVDVHHIESAF